MKVLRGILAALLLTALITGTGARARESESVATLYAVWGIGGESGEEQIDEYEFGYDGELTVDMLADGLSELTGLDFAIDSVAETDAGVSIDWAAESTLIAGLGEREQNEKFFFHDVDSLSWFMLDSLYISIINNLDVGGVYYTMNGGEDLFLPNLSGEIRIPGDSAYLGSAHYLANAAEYQDCYGLVGIESPLALTETVRLNGTIQTYAAPVDGGYRFDYAAEDGLVSITNMAFVNPANADMEAEAYAPYCVEQMDGGEPLGDVRAIEDDAYSARFAYPAFFCYWDLGEGEELKSSVAMVIPTDTHTYMYRMAVDADQGDAYSDDFMSVFGGLALEAVE